MKLDELATAAGIAPRTVRYYVQRGLLPAPTFRGKDSAYGPEHLARLRAIRRLQDEQLPLDLIQRQLADLSLSAIEELANAKNTPPPRHVETRAPIPGYAPRPAEWARHTLAPGLELHIADGAGVQAKRLAEQLLLIARDNLKETL